MIKLFEQNEVVQFTYPITTHVGFPTVEHRKRTAKILKIRDLVAHPITALEFMRRPFVRRTRYLILGEEQGKVRQFYAGNTLELHSPGELRLALYEPLGLRPEKILSRPFEDTIEDRKRLLNLLRSMPSLDFGDLELRIFADDLRLVS